MDNAEASLCITTDATQIGIGAHLWYVRKPAREISISDLRVGGLAYLISAHSALVDQSQQQWHVFEKESYAIFQAFAKWRALIISVSRLPRSGDEPSVVLFSDYTVALAKFINNNDEDLFSGKTAIKARRFRAWQMEMSEFDYINIRMAHVPGVCNVLSDLFSRCAERLEQSHVTPVDEMANEAPTMPIYLPTYGEAQEEDGDNTVDHIYTGAIYDYELSHLAMTPSQAEIVADSYAVDETMYLSVRLKAVWAAANVLLDSETYSDITSVENAKAVAWIEARKFITSLSCKENGAMGLFTQSTNREQDLRKLPWVLVIPGPAVFVNELRLVTAYDPQQQLQSARQGLLLYAHDCKIHVPYDRVLRVLQAIAWWPGMGSDLLAHINDCDLCSRLYPSKHLPYRGVTVGNSRFTTISIDHKNVPTSEGISCKYALSVTCAYSGWTIFIPQQDLSAMSTALGLYIQWFMKYGFPTHLYCDRGKAFNNVLMKELLAMSGTALHLAMTGHPEGNSMIEQRHRVLQQVINVHYETCGVMTDSDILLLLSHAEMIINQVPNRDGFSVYARVFGMVAPLPAMAKYGNEDPAREVDRSSSLALVQAIQTTASTLATRYNLTKDARAKENELYKCNPTLVQQRDRRAKEQLKVGDMVWLEGNQQAKVRQVLYDDLGAARGVIANAFVQALPLLLSLR